MATRSEGLGSRVSLPITNTFFPRAIPLVGCELKTPNYFFSHTLDDGRPPLNLDWVDGGRWGRPLKRLIQWEESLRGEK
jgi:hypothetical protein